MTTDRKPTCIACAGAGGGISEEEVQAMIDTSISEIPNGWELIPKADLINYFTEDGDVTEPIIGTIDGLWYSLFPGKVVIGDLSTTYSATSGNMTCKRISLYNRGTAGYPYKINALETLYRLATNERCYAASDNVAIAKFNQLLEVDINTYNNEPINNSVGYGTGNYIMYAYRRIKI